MVESVSMPLGEMFLVGNSNSTDELPDDARDRKLRGSNNNSNMRLHEKITVTQRLSGIRSPKSRGFLKPRDFRVIGTYIFP